MPNIHGSEYHLGRNTIVVLIVIQLTSLLFGLMTLQSLSGVSCTSQSSSSICQLNVQTGAINSSVTRLSKSFNCVTNSTGNPNCWVQSPSPSSQVSCLFSGCPLNNIAASLIYMVNILLGAIGAIVEVLFIITQLLFLMLFILTVFLPSLFTMGAFGSFGIIFAILFSGATIIMAIYAIYLIVNRLPYVGKH